MKIAVCVKHVPDATVTKRIDPQTKRLDRSGEGALNHFDTQAVEEALQIKERNGDGEVILISMGRSGLSTRTQGIGMGADRAVLVSDEQVVGSDMVATSRVLAAALEREGADLRLWSAGRRLRRGRPRGCVADRRAAGDLAGRRARGRRREGQGKRQTESFGYDVIEAPLRQSSPSRMRSRAALPVAQGIMGAKKKPQETVAASDLDLEADNVGEAGSRTSVVALNDPPSRGDALKIGTTAAPPRRSPISSRNGSCCDRGLPRAPRGRAAEGRSRRSGQGCATRRRRRRRRARVRGQGRGSPGRALRGSEGVRRGRPRPRGALPQTRSTTGTWFARRWRHRDLRASVFAELPRVWRRVSTRHHWDLVDLVRQRESRGKRPASRTPST